MFNKLIGNEPVKAKLRSLVESGRVPNSLIFAGPESVGKRQFALDLARSLMCPAADRSGGCGSCSSCQRVANFSIPEATDKTRDEFRSVFFSEHPDVGSVVAYKRNILVDAIRDLEREAFFNPYEAQKRLFLIDDADKMNDAASNALLKTLEEPAETSFIVLITSRPDNLLDTILSRCQAIRFAPVETSEIAAFLEKEMGLEKNEALLAARLSGGSLAKARTFDAAAYRASRDEMLAVIGSALAGTGLADMLRTSEKMNDAKNKDGYEAAIDTLETLIRDIWLLANGMTHESLVNNDINDLLAPLAAGARPSELAKWLISIEQLRQSFVINVNRKIATDSLFVKMAGN